METSRIIEGYQKNLPESVLHRIQQLHEKEARIVGLEAELSQLRKDHAQLEHDLESYRVGSSFADVAIEPADIETARINRCPDEILCLIFENYVFTPYNHFYIRCLLLVCRRWYALVANTAKLWARIEIDWPWDLFDIGSRKSLFPYIFTCLNRSNNLRITVDLDMQDLNHDRYISEELVQHTKTIVDEDEHERITEHIWDQVWNFHSTRVDSQIESVIERLIGADRAYIKRWKTMKLYLPYKEDMAIRVWNILARGLEAIENVVLDNFPSASPDIFMPDFKNVKNFSLKSAEDASERPPITSFGLSPSTLEHLDIEVGNPSIDFVELLHFQRLRTLHLLFLYKEDISLDFSIFLPHLERLTLAGKSSVLARLHFNLPSLDLLRLDLWGVDMPLPTIHPRHIQVSIPPRPSRVELKKVIRDYMLLSDVLESITINHAMERDDVKEVVAQSRLEGKASLLTQVIIEHEGGYVERICV